MAAAQFPSVFSLAKPSTYILTGYLAEKPNFLFQQARFTVNKLLVLCTKSKMKEKQMSLLVNEIPLKVLLLFKGISAS